MRSIADEADRCLKARALAQASSHSGQLYDHYSYASNQTQREMFPPTLLLLSKTYYSSDSRRHEQKRAVLKEQSTHKWKYDPQAIQDGDEFVSSSDLEKCSIASLAH